MKANLHSTEGTVWYFKKPWVYIREKVLTYSVLVDDVDNDAQFPRIYTFHDVGHTTHLHEFPIEHLENNEIERKTMHVWYIFFNIKQAMQYSWNL